ncbi:MAG: hypothetical protein WKG00_23335 [Polyangiaceae bacterium]
MPARGAHRRRAGIGRRQRPQGGHHAGRVRSAQRFVLQAPALRAHLTRGKVDCHGPERRRSVLEQYVAQRAVRGAGGDQRIDRDIDLCHGCIGAEQRAEPGGAVAW